MREGGLGLHVSHCSTQPNRLARGGAGGQVAASRTTQTGRGLDGCIAATLDGSASSQGSHHDCCSASHICSWETARATGDSSSHDRVRCRRFPGRALFHRHRVDRPRRRCPAEIHRGEVLAIPNRSVRHPSRQPSRGSRRRSHAEDPGTPGRRASVRGAACAVRVGRSRKLGWQEGRATFVR